MASATALQETVGNRLGPCKLLLQLGEGGMGTVSLAEQEVPAKQRLALKFIKAGMIRPGPLPASRPNVGPWH